MTPPTDSQTQPPNADARRNLPAGKGAPGDKPRTTSRSTPSRPLPEVEVPDGYLAVGRIVGVHGIRGELKVEPYTDFPERFAPGVVLALGPTLEEVVVAAGRPHKGHYLLAFDEIRDRNAADELRGLWLFVDEAEAVELDDDTFWVHDILGLDVVTDEGAALGVVSDVLFTGANEVYVVSTPEGGEVLLPAIDDVILKIDLAERRMTVHLLPGILD
jgi:16S rRNA processing protein RimM